MLTDRQLLGLKGERIAARWLLARGWIILDQRFRSGHRDLDIVATAHDPTTHNRLITFVEVRTRVSTTYGAPIESVGYRKQRELIRSARDWIRKNKCSNDTYRFDVLGVLLAGQKVRIQHVPDAFRVGWFG